MRPLISTPLASRIVLPINRYKMAVLGSYDARLVSDS